MKSGDQRVELKKEEVEHSHGLLSFGPEERCWCGNPAQHKVFRPLPRGMTSDTIVPYSLLLCTKHFGMWFKAPGSRQKPTFKGKKAPMKPLDRSIPHRMFLKRMDEPTIWFTGSKIAEAHLDWCGRNFFFSIYKQSKASKKGAYNSDRYYVSVTQLESGEMRHNGTERYRNPQYWVQDIAQKNFIPAVLYAWKKEHKKTIGVRGSRERNSWERFEILLAIKVRDVFDQLGLKDDHDLIKTHWMKK